MSSVNPLMALGANQARLFALAIAALPPADGRLSRAFIDVTERILALELLRLSTLSGCWELMEALLALAWACCRLSSPDKMIG
jgi:hypothetical protein